MNEDMKYEATEINFQEFGRDYAPVMTVGDWFKTMLLLLIPVLNIVLPLVWAFGSNVNPSKRNFFRVQLIFFVIGAFLFVLVGAMGFAMHPDAFLH